MKIDISPNTLILKVDSSHNKDVHSAYLNKLFVLVVHAVMSLQFLCVAFSLLIKHIRSAKATVLGWDFGSDCTRSWSLYTFLLSTDFPFSVYLFI